MVLIRRNNAVAQYQSRLKGQVLLFLHVLPKHEILLVWLIKSFDYGKITLKLEPTLYYKY